MTAPVILPAIGRNAETWPVNNAGALSRLLSATTGAQRDGSAKWLPAFRESIELIDDTWAAACSTEPGISFVRAGLLSRLRTATAEAAALVPALRAGSLRRLAQHLQALNGAGGLDDMHAQCAVDIAAAVVPDETSVIPTPSRASAQAAAEIFDAAVEVSASLGDVPDVLAVPLSATFRVATAPSSSRGPRGPLRVEPLLDVLLASLT
eukprot:CAMPEP_0179108610 /NCGR_PEP_ID=MMETSP0796-20121207/50599_1 /TAXON_ID=73915 /ORGANISM="Pyrodinium bahamense, Strain pbaha01" /LENGTH=207 /DNA_ID=CAMNT_0020806687 /DNA_START=4 /DNA_END=623 /DNA_ORIENTATION=+